MPERTDGNGTTAASLSRFVTERVAPLAKAFASTPLMELRVRTSEGSIRLVKAAETTATIRTLPAKTAPRGARPQLMPTTESGHPYDVISADVVGVFTSVPGAASPGEHVDEDTVLGHIEALKLKHPVRSGAPCVLIAQAAEDGQVVDFGEPLFVVDRAETPKPAAQQEAALVPEALEPPRL
ncbi:MAG TPA: acetyl-CoA carboxylase biotin carboxyl carrier protein subunit [Candidatus Eremiobacteraceae bacterium]|jgi:acetyl-CoA carboxylase biotin carboxyl carrier protein|nr:acetyl-CoA carboxylase biotin carboxyl carrier protein subunit [Candidatus Eremiobacteraceae bacterium]